jgi:hypothetical protein
MHGSDVPTMMTRVETALVRAARSPDPSPGPLYVFTEGDDELGISPLRETATIKVEFPSGSDRPVFGDAIRFGKRIMRRGLRWYMAPIMEQQSRFNHAVLDLMERLRLQNENLRTEVETLRRAAEDARG